MPLQVVKRRSRGFICVNAHPEGCRRNVERWAEAVSGRTQPAARPPRNVLVIGASTGYMSDARGNWRLDGCTLVVTLEPCTMCAGALLAARVDRLIYGAADPRAGAAGSLWDVLRDRRLPHRVEVIGGVLEDECAALLRGFFGRRR